jgi:hypothetical protein
MNKRFFIFFGLSLISMHIWSMRFVVPDGIQKINSTYASSYPYISGNTFRAFCDFIIDETRIPFDPSAVFNGDVIFLKTDYVDFFFNVIHPHIPVSYILLTHNSDCAIDAKYCKYLDNEKLIAWFAQNAMIEHKKLIPIPIGLANRHWSHGDIGILEAVMATSHAKNIMLYMNYAVSTNIAQRQAVCDIFQHKSFCYVAQKKSFRDYLTDIASSQFVLSPPGNGFDCHRTWEALYLGAIPLVQSSSMNKAFEGMPVIIVDNWRWVTKEFLEQKYNEIKKSSYTTHKLYADYWFAMIGNVQREWCIKNK